MFQEITAEEFGKEYNIMNIEKDWAAITADDGERRNSVIIGWAGLGILWRIPVFSVYIHATRFSKQVFDNAKYYSVSILLGENRTQHMKALAYLGSKSGRDEDKMQGAEKLGLTAKEELIDGEKVPYFAESDYVVFCRMRGMTDFDLNKLDAPEAIMTWYGKEGVHTIYEGEIVKVLKREGK